MSYHLIGLGGIGMSGLARLLKQKNIPVQGSDEKQTALLEQLIKEGITVTDSLTSSLEGKRVVYSTAIKEDHPEMIEAKRLNCPLLHRSELLAECMEGKKGLLVLGTHGKTTTSSLLTETLCTAGKDPSFALGGVLVSSQKNAGWGQGEYFVAETDESDGSFRRLSGVGGIVTNLDEEHLDYWKSKSALEQGFIDAISRIEDPNLLFWCKDDPNLRGLSIQGVSYGFRKDADLNISSWKTGSQGVTFSLVFDGRFYENIELSCFGAHNVLNAAAVFGLSSRLDIPESAIRRAFQTFQGVQRRLEWKGSFQGIDVYDDYGHHPTEIKATLSALRQKAPERRIVALFQPHRYSRLSCFEKDLYACFETADLIVLTDVYSAGESAFQGFSQEALFSSMQQLLKKQVIYFPFDSLAEGLSPYLRPLDVVVTFGAGTITTKGPELIRKAKVPRLQVGLLFGGTSSEHEVSISSAKAISEHLDRSLYDVHYFGLTKEGNWIVGLEALELLEQKKAHPQERLTSNILRSLQACDLCIPVFHGPAGEDGMIQGFLDTLQIPYVGCDYRSAALCMQKAWTKSVTLHHGIPTPAFIEIIKGRYENNPAQFLEAVQKDLRFPLWVKPVHLGSSIGVKRSCDLESLQENLAYAFSFDDRLIVEEEVKGREIEFAVLGNDHLEIAPCCEILSHGIFYDYERKYVSNPLSVEIPAKLTPMQEQIGKDLALRVYQILGCQGLARVDFRLDEAGNFWLNEVNPFPGFTGISGYPKMWGAAGRSFSLLWNALIARALFREEKMKVLRAVTR